MSISDFLERNRILTGVAVIVVMSLMVLLARSFMSPPQMGVDDEVFKTVDALFTAITSKDKKRLDDSDNRLKSQRESGRLPAAAAKSLEAIVKQARTDQWDPAAHRLYDFMLAQRRLK